MNRDRSSGFVDCGFRSMRETEDGVGFGAAGSETMTSFVSWLLCTPNGVKTALVGKQASHEALTELFPCISYRTGSHSGLQQENMDYIVPPRKRHVIRGNGRQAMIPAPCDSPWWMLISGPCPSRRKRGGPRNQSGMMTNSRSRHRTPPVELVVSRLLNSYGSRFLAYISSLGKRNRFLRAPRCLCESSFTFWISLPIFMQLGVNITLWFSSKSVGSASVIGNMADVRNFEVGATVAPRNVSTCNDIWYYIFEKCTA
jgi:hypothetical protein